MKLIKEIYVAVAENNGEEQIICLTDTRSNEDVPLFFPSIETMEEIEVMKILETWTKIIKNKGFSKPISFLKFIRSEILGEIECKH